MLTVEKKNDYLEVTHRPYLTLVAGVTLVGAGLIGFLLLWLFVEEADAVVSATIAAIVAVPGIFTCGMYTVRRSHFFDNGTIEIVTRRVFLLFLPIKRAFLVSEVDSIRIATSREQRVGAGLLSSNEYHCFVSLQITNLGHFTIGMVSLSLKDLPAEGRYDEPPLFGPEALRKLLSALGLPLEISLKSTFS
ncbi:MAG: hypothetical protein WDZ79_02985 [Candidatus Paceibacterota bacterium]